MPILTDKMRSLMPWCRRRSVLSASNAPESMPKTSKNPNSPILHLPLDIWYLVFDHLTGFDLLRLSGTCRDLRTLILDGFPEDIRNFTPLKEKFDFCSVVASVVPEAWACIQCSRLHEVDVKDLPNSRFTSSRTFRCEDEVWDENLYGALATIGPEYRVHPRHVQLALKYAGMKNLKEPYKRYLANLTAPCQLLQYPWSWMVSISENWVRYHAVPKIVTVDAGTPNSALRYVLHEKWIFRAGKSTLPEKWTWQHIEDGALRDLTTCCHLESGAFEWPRPSKVGRFHLSATPFRRRLEKMVDSQQEETIELSCSHCPTDTTCRLYTGESGHGYIAVNVWKDLDPSKSEWLIRTTYNDRRMKVPRMKGYVPGATRYLYENDGERLKSTTEMIRETLFPSSAPSAKTKGRKRLRKPPQKLYSVAPSASSSQQKRANQMALAFF